MQASRVPAAPAGIGAAHDLEMRWLILALYAGAFVRLFFVLTTDFPLNDGGMFYDMVRDLQNAHYMLPFSISYNQAEIPFAYPPLAFYVAGILDDLTPLSLLDIFRFLPMVISVGTIAAFYLLSRTMLPSRNAAIFSVFGFALLPRTIEWFIMGGGLTRVLGFLFAILALQQVYMLYTSQNNKHVPWAALCCAAAVLSHPEMAWFTLYSAALFFIVLGRNSAGIRNSALVSLGTLALSAPWWGTVLIRYGASPFFAASQHGVALYAGVVQLLLLNVSDEQTFSALGALAILGALLCLRDKKLLFPVWLAVIFVLDPRKAQSLVTIPVAMLLGIGVNNVLLPLLQGTARSQSHDTTPWEDTVAIEPMSHSLSTLSRAVLAFILVCATISVWSSQTSRLSSLSIGERMAMQWVSANTPASSTFIVVPADAWPVDRSSEWFPVLAKRVSLGTVQGSEWVSGQEFANRIKRSKSLRQCAQGTPDCLEQWAQEAGLVFTHVYIPKRPPIEETVKTGDCCTGMLNTLSSDPHYRLIYDGARASVFVRQDAQMSLATQP